MSVESFPACCSTETTRQSVPSRKRRGRRNTRVTTVALAAIRTRGKSIPDQDASAWRDKELNLSAWAEGPCAETIGIGIAEDYPLGVPRIRAQGRRAAQSWDTMKQHPTRPRLKEGSDMLVLSRKLGEKI